MTEQLDEVTIRIAQPDDALALAQVHVRSWQEAYADIVPAAYLASLDPVARAEQWATDLRRGPQDGVTTWVAVAGERHVGFVSLGPARDEDASRGDREIYSIYLDPGTWGHGVARELMRTVIGETGERTRILLWVLAANERARHFYRRHGFHADGVERYENVGGADLLEVRYRRN
ncbi:GNAT family N-acetyltransferase [Cellulomonas edaphi]|uniref:GNAT family N-acetyltransferase n=1 Tax=Cellulomonas edaphi TaxID=3053468 RepID=A0ABT7S7W1_9CELL|nr:GNAT family N-acetyltransferase [Cellulomons edaphi]MDM7831701.1 GNAT family N-acetyltransferase [Cellulomons edaphi]